jgi:hypothetical protein
MKQLRLDQCYVSPEAELIDISPLTVLCQSDEDGSGFSTSLEDMTENDYTFSF